MYLKVRVNAIYKFMILLINAYIKQLIKLQFKKNSGIPFLYSINLKFCQNIVPMRISGDIYLQQLPTVVSTSEI